MVPDDAALECKIQDNIKKSTATTYTIFISPSKSVKSVFKAVSELLHYDVANLQLTIKRGAIVLNEFMDKTLAEAKVGFDDVPTLIVNELISAADDDFCSSSTATTTPMVPITTAKSLMAIMAPPENTSTASSSSSACANYVGLVNQAMTCYLNSLLQVLYMTPEFRNALYNWESDGCDLSKSIPFQLQKLFLNMQTSTKSAVETTDLTTSFGWKVAEAWQQHDIQELCRVMFDALEQKFKDTKQANLINDLYEGKMLDYVMCLECRTEKSREDTFQDIPLPVRPFNSTVAYNSVEEALRAFVQPETLDGNNQYFCEKCNKKCDAHKGLKFTKFPYLLTLHLKRFDFDYNSISGHRIKLNDKVVFPETLNLNSFISDLRCMDAMDDRESIVKSDDCSTTDSGSALDDENGHVAEMLLTSTTTNGQFEACGADDDEGIDVSSGTTNHQENEKNRLHEIQGPYIYELFSIMIHSGSASGGHYYAYIKDFSKNQWFCFNDQSVTTVTNEDIHKTYGGGNQKTYYSGAYSSSTNAYMLMYRQIDKERNCEAYTVDEFPPHIRKLLEEMRKNEETERKRQKEINDSTHVKVYCHHPERHVLEDHKVFAQLDYLLSEVTEDAYKKFKLNEYVALEDCRLVGYCGGAIECSYDPSCKLSDISSYTFYLEIKQPGSEFDVYETGGMMMKAYIITLETEEVDGPTSIWVKPDATVRDLQKMFAIRYGIETPHIVREMYSNRPNYLDDPNAPVQFSSKCNSHKLYVGNALNLPDNTDKPFAESKLMSIIDRFVHVVLLNVSIPYADSTTLDIQSIPTLDVNQCLDRIEIAAGGDREPNPSSLRVSPLPGPNSELFGDQSNSEDSSLSDSDRTLVGDAPGDNIGVLSSNSNSPGDQHMASPTEAAATAQEEDFADYICQVPQEDMNWDDETPSPIEHTPANYYLKAHVVDGVRRTDGADKECRVLVDKRMTVGMLKKNIEPLVGVPMEYFKIFKMRANPTQEYEWSTLTDNLATLKDGDRLVVKLGRVLKENEYALKVYRLLINSAEHAVFLFDWIVGKEQPAASAKREMMLQAKKEHMLDIPYDKCRLRKKTHKTPGRILMDDDRFVNVHAGDLYLQEIDGPERANAQHSMFVRQWHPSRLELSPFTEVYIDQLTKEELAAKISAMSNIPTEFLEIAHIKSSFPCDMSVLDVHKLQTWNMDEQDLTSYPIHVDEDGGVFYYRDSREELKELSPESRKELRTSEEQRLGKYDRVRKRPEHGLKIYLDSSPKNDYDVGLD